MRPGPTAPRGLLLRWSVQAELRLRATPLAGPSVIVLLLLAGGAYLGLLRPQALALGPGTARIAGQLATGWLAPFAALLLLLAGTPLVLDGLQRRSQDGLDPLLGLDAPPAVRRGAGEGLTTLLLFGCLALVLAVPFAWLELLGVLPSGSWPALLLRLGGAALLGTASCHAARWRSHGFGPSLLRALLLQAAVVFLGLRVLQ